jgi:hypothetical protein
MGCINAKVSRIFEACNVSIRPIIAVFAVTVTFVSSMIVKVTHQDTNMKVTVTSEERPIVNVGLVCTVSVSEDIEMWWCDGWRILWNNRLNMIWQEA